MTWRQDVYGNHEARLEFVGLTTELRISVEMTLELLPVNPFDFLLDTRQCTPPFGYREEQAAALQPYLDARPAPAALQHYLQRMGSLPRSVTDHVIGLNKMLHADLIYQTRMESGVRTPEETLKLGSGSCRDSGWLLAHLLRHSGLAARFVSGYLVHLRAAFPAMPQPNEIDEDSAGLHAWCEVFLPEAGWIGLDPGSGLLAGSHHIALACAPQPSAATPIKGWVGIADAAMAHHLSLTRLSL